MALAFRQRIFLWLVVVSAVPATIAIAVSLFSPQIAEPVGGTAAWERAAGSWRDVRGSVDTPGLSPAVQAAIDRHSAELSTSLRRARQAQAIKRALSGILAGVAVALTVLVAGGAVHLAGHLSRQLSRPIDELITWTGLLAKREPLPSAPAARGAPEFAVLRDAFRTMAGELEAARAREVEATELRSFRDLARQVAHELKNPLTPLRFAVGRLAHTATPEQRELIEILDGESARLEQMARDFAALGRLPEGPPAPVDLGELLDGLVRATVPERISVRVERTGDLPLISGHYEPLRRAFQNLILNACEACDARVTDARTPGRPEEERRADVQTPRGPGAKGEIVVALRAVGDGSAGEVEVKVRDTGEGVPPEVVSRVFEPYFTTRSHGTGLGLALARQTIHHHGGTISVSSERGVGTTFTVRLPAGQEAARTDAPTHRVITRATRA